MMAVLWWTALVAQAGVLSEPRALEPQALELTKRVQPTYPLEAMGLDLDQTRCLVEVIIEPDGVPSAVTVAECPKVFHAHTRQAIQQWRWAPPRWEGQAVRASTTIRVSYALGTGSPDNAAKAHAGVAEDSERPEPTRLEPQALELTKRVQPTYPPEAKALGLDRTRCLVEVTIEPDGVPSAVTAVDCPTVFHAETEQTILQWRFAPPQWEGEPVRARTTIGITYALGSPTPKRYADEVQACHEEQLKKQPDLAGRVVVKGRVDDGRVVGTPQVVDNSTGSGALALCLLDAVSGWSFPKDGVYSWPFVFQPE
jgi:outer membrane biosynthesis protein TonB